MLNLLTYRTYIGDRLEDGDVIIVDDMIHTGSKLNNCVKEVRKTGKNNIYAFITHNLLTPKSFEEVEKLSISELVTTNTISNVFNHIYY